jgi:hypothetical protein
MNMQSGQGYTLFQAGMKRLLGPLFQAQKRARAASALGNEDELKGVDDNEHAGEWHPKPFEECKVSERPLLPEECKNGVLVEQLQTELTAVKAELKEVERRSRRKLEQTVREAQRDAAKSERHANAVITMTKLQLRNTQAKLGQFEGLVQELADTEQELLEVGQRLERSESQLAKVKDELAMARILLSNPELSNRASSVRGPSETLSTVALYTRHVLLQAEEVAPVSSDSDDEWRIDDAALALQELDDASLNAHYAGEAVPGLKLQTPKRVQAQRPAPEVAAPKPVGDGSKVIKKRVRFGQDLVLVLEKFVKEGGCTKKDIEFIKALLLVLSKEKKHQNFQEYSQKFRIAWRGFTQQTRLFNSFKPFYFKHRNE